MTTWDTFNPADVHGGTLTNGNLTYQAGGGANCFARAIKDQANAGKWYFELQINYSSGLEFSSGCGLATLFATYANLQAACLNGVMIQPNAFGASMACDGTGIYSDALHEMPGRCGIAVNFDDKLVFTRPRPTSGWNDNLGDPVSGTGGVDISVLMAKGPLVPAVMGQSGIGDSFDSHFDPATMTGAAPAGYTAGWPDRITPPLTTVFTALVWDGARIFPP